MTDLARAESCGTGQVGRQINVQHKFRSNFCAFQLSLSMIKFWCVFPPPPHPFVSCSCVRKWPKPAELSPSPVNPIAIRNIRGNHFANAARPQLAFCCGVCVCVEEGRGWRGTGLVPTCSIFHSNLFSCACIFSLRVASAHPCISFWLARFVWFNYRLTAATLPRPRLRTRHRPFA